MIIEISSNHIFIFPLSTTTQTVPIPFNNNPLTTLCFSSRPQPNIAASNFHEHARNGVRLLFALSLPALFLCSRDHVPEPVRTHALMLR